VQNPTKQILQQKFVKYRFGAYWKYLGNDIDVDPEINS
jgi:hypothetical protein